MKKLKVYHQCGHNDIWNYDIYKDDSVGDGFIFAPKMASITKIDNLIKDFGDKSFFDPQFYCPGSKEKKFSQFDFFPNIITDGYSTIDFQELAYISADKCIDYQVNYNFQFLLIPTIVYEETPTNYIDRIKNLYIEPYIDKLDRIENNKKVLLTVVIKDSQLKDKDYINKLLNVITSYEEIDGIYLVPMFSGSSKRIKDAEFIYELLCFINILKENDMYVHLAYTDIEGIIFSLANIDSVSIGSYENLRYFTLKNFLEKTGGNFRGGPKRRIYSNKLFQWIDCDYLGALEELECFNDLFEQNKYINLNIPDENNWHFKFPDLYKHYLMSVFNQYKELPNSWDDRYKFIISELKEAMNLNTMIEDEGILFDDKSNGEHLAKWITAINRFKKNKKGK